jgi:hypothetical protein
MSTKEKRSGRFSQSTSPRLNVRPIGSLPDKAVSIVVYGPSGTGKTTFAASAPGKILYLDVKDEGTASIADVKGIDVFEVEEFADFEEAYWWLRKNPKAYKTVIIDTCTQLQGMVVSELKGDKKAAGKFKDKKMGDFGTMSRGDWGDIAGMLREWLGNYRDLTSLGINVVFIAQHRTFNLTDEEEENAQMLAPEIGPALMPSVARTLNASVGIVVNTYIREHKGKDKKKTIQYCLGIGPSPLYTRKVRKPKSVRLPDVIVDPTFQDVLDITKGD